MVNVNAIDTSEALVLFDAGVLTGVVVAPMPNEAGCYHMLLKCKNRSQPYLLAAQRDPVRIFRSADAAIATAAKIGFRSITFDLPKL